MDEQVEKAMARWPNVPAAYGWLRLDRRGIWYLVDRNQPDFDEAVHGAGSPITSSQIIEFIHRNYLHDDDGRWFWQNGPQRAFVDLDSAPMVLRVLGTGDDTALVTHTGLEVTQASGGWQGPEGEVLLETEHGPGVVHDLDLEALSPDEDDDGHAFIVLAGNRIVLQSLVNPSAELGWVAKPR